MFLETKNKLKEILQKYQLEKNQEEIEKLIESIVSEKRPDNEVDLYLMVRQNFDLKKASQVGLEISEQVIELEREKRKEVLEKKERPSLEPEISEEMTEKTPEGIRPQSEIIGLDQLIEEIKQEAGLSFPDEVLTKRFKTTIFSYLKDIRDEIELKEILEKSQKIGGMGLAGEKIEQIIKTLDKEKSLGRIELKPEVSEVSKAQLGEGIKAPEELKAQKIFEAKPQEVVSPLPQKEFKPELPVMAPKKEVVLLSSVATPPDLRSSVATPPDQRPSVAPKEAPPDLRPSVETTPDKKQITKFQLGSLAPVLDVEVKPPFAPAFAEATAGEKAMAGEAEKKEEVFGMPLPKRPVILETREKVEEIKPRIRILGPVEEIRTLTLDDWRRFGKPENAAAKIEEKINLLAEESLLKKAEAIKAWKESEVNRLYLEIGRESIEKGNISVAQVIEERKKQEKKSLSLEEFNAVAELNQKLRF